MDRSPASNTALAAMVTAFLAVLSGRNNEPHQAIDPRRYVALGLTHVQYDASDGAAKLLALVTLSPIFLLCSYITIILYRRELTFVNALIGQLGCEGLNWALKRLIRQPRPHAGQLGKGYGMPSSHSQFMGFFCAFFLSHFFLHHPRAAKPPTVVNTMRRFEHLCAMAGIVTLTALTCYSRHRLAYHTPAQIFVGVAIGLAIGFPYYYLTEYLPRQPIRLPAILVRSSSRDKGKDKERVNQDDVSLVTSKDSARVNQDDASLVTSKDFAAAAGHSSSIADRRIPLVRSSSSHSSDLDNAFPPSPKPTSSKTKRRAGSSGHKRRRSSLSALVPELHPAPPIRQLILDHPLAVAFRLRDSWTVWLDGGIEGEYGAWRAEWERRRIRYPYRADGLSTPSEAASHSIDHDRDDDDGHDADTDLVQSGPIPTTSSPTAVKLMKLALRQAAKCQPTKEAFCVGCVVALAGTDTVVATGYSRELEGNTHAEQNALAKLLSAAVPGSAHANANGDPTPEQSASAPASAETLPLPELALDLYTTMEPCSERLSGSTPCAQRLLAFNEAQPVLSLAAPSRLPALARPARARIARVYQGVGEPADFIAQNVGLEMLRGAGVDVRRVVPPEAQGEGIIEREALRLAKYGHTDQPAERGQDSRFWAQAQAK